MRLQLVASFLLFPSIVLEYHDIIFVCYIFSWIARCYQLLQLSALTRSSNVSRSPNEALRMLAL